MKRHWSTAAGYGDDQKGSRKWLFLPWAKWPLKASKMTHKWLCGPGYRSIQIDFGHGEVRVYRGTGVSRGVRRTTWERSLKNWELQISCFEEFLGGENVLGLVPASPSHFGIRLYFWRPHFPSPSHYRQTFFLGRVLGVKTNYFCLDIPHYVKYFQDRQPA